MPGHIFAPRHMLIGVLMLAYFIPVAVAMLRRHRFTVTIGLLNLALGWTGFFWVVALVWAATV